MAIAPPAAANLTDRSTLLARANEVIKLRGATRFPILRKLRHLLDANAIITLLNDTTSNAARRARREQPSDLAIPAVVAYELFYGAFKSRRAAQNLALIDALQFVVLEFDKEDARQAGAIRASLAVKGTPIGPYDVLIAAQAVARNLILVTHDTQEFGRVPGLRFEDWQT